MRRRAPARKKDDAEDARIACRLALDRFTSLQTLIPQGEVGGELRAIARDDERAGRDERRLLNRLRADLVATFPAALVIAGDDMGRPTFLRLLERWPTAPGYLVRAKASTIRLGCSQLLAIGAQRKAWEKRMGALLLGAPRRGRAHQSVDDEIGDRFPGGEIYLSFAGPGDRLAARVAGEIGEHIEQAECDEEGRVPHERHRVRADIEQVVAVAQEGGQRHGAGGASRTDVAHGRNGTASKASKTCHPVAISCRRRGTGR